VVSSENSADHALDRGTLAEIQRKIEQGKLNAASRLHAMNDKEMIDIWKSDLGKVLHTFKVRSVIFVWPLLTVHSKAGLPRKRLPKL
jgi:hypothetical protein